MGEDYQQMVSENLSLQSVPGYRQSLPVFSTVAQNVTGRPQLSGSGNPAAVQMSRVTDFSQGPVEPSGSPYHLAIEGKGFFESARSRRFHELYRATAHSRFLRKDN